MSALLGPSKTADPELKLRSTSAEALTARELIAGVVRVANHPTYKNWARLMGETEVIHATEVDELTLGFELGRREAIEKHVMPQVREAVERLRVALSAIAHGKQTSKDIQGWKAAAASMRIIPNFVIEGAKVRTELTWWLPWEVLKEPDLGSFGLLLSRSADAMFAAALMLLLDRDDDRATTLRECALGPACDRERFSFSERKRKYCCPEHWPDRRADWRERKKAEREVAKRLPRGSISRARSLVEDVQDQGLKCDELVQRALNKANAEHRPTNGRRTR